MNALENKEIAVRKPKTLTQLKRDRGIGVHHADNRGGSTQRGYGRRWQKERSLYLKQHPICECDECKKLNRVRAATVVDHDKPHKGNKELFWDKTNWRAMAKECHDRKTATQDGGFGNAIKATPAAKPNIPVNGNMTINEAGGASIPTN